MSELPGGVAPAEVPLPRESALGVVVRKSPDGRYKVLLGHRSRHSRFMPDHLAFPGGRVDPGDRPGEDGVHLRCVVREILEETGLSIPGDRWIAAGERTTPPMFPIRFRTWFFVAEVPETLELPASPPSGENESLRFEFPGEIVVRWQRGEIQTPPPVLAILRTLSEIGDDSTTAALARAVARANVEEERAPRIEFVPGIRVFPVRAMTLPPATHTNVWLPGGERSVVVDPGSADAGEIERLLRVVGRLAEDGAPPVAVVLTHHHQDHVSGAAAVARSLDLPVRAHPVVLERTADVLDGASVSPIEAGDVIDLRGLTMRAVLTEGHAPGHLAFHVVEPGVLISGDLASALSTILIDPSDGDMDLYLASLETVMALPVTRLLPAHGPPLPRSALARARDHRLLRERRVRDAIRAGNRDVSSIAQLAYADTPDAPAYLRERQTLSHLKRLERLGEVFRDNDPREERYRPA